MKHSDPIDKAAKRLRILAAFAFVLAPIFSWGSVVASDETAVFASLSRMIWYSGDPWRILLAMLVLFLPMLASFFLAHGLSGISKAWRTVCRVCMLVSCAVLYVGAMEIMPSDGVSMTNENIWHGILSFGGMLMIFLTYCLYAAFIRRSDADGARLLLWLLVFTLITGAFAVLNVFDTTSYVIASAASELYVLTMLSLVGYLTYYLAYRRAKELRFISAAQTDFDQTQGDDRADGKRQA